MPVKNRIEFGFSTNTFRALRIQELTVQVRLLVTLHLPFFIQLFKHKILFLSQFLLCYLLVCLVRKKMVNFVFVRSINGNHRIHYFVSFHLCQYRPVFIFCNHINISTLFVFVVFINAIQSPFHKQIYFFKFVFKVGVSLCIYLCCRHNIQFSKSTVCGILNVQSSYLYVYYIP